MMRHHFHFRTILLVLGLAVGFAACRTAQEHDSDVDQASKMAVSAQDPLVRYYVVADG